MQHKRLRAQAEARLAAELRRTGTAAKNKIVAMLGEPPDVTRISPQVWDELEREQRQRVAILLYLLMRGAWSGMKSSLKIDPTRSPYGPTRAQVSSALVDSARARADAVVRNRIQSIEDAATAATPDELGRALSRLDSPHEAARLAVTETTSAINAAELAYIEQVEIVLSPTAPVATPSRDLLFPPAAGQPPALPPALRPPPRTELFLIRWYTQADSRVCQVCGPLHGTDQSTWQRSFSYGPPAHPNCRCWLTYESNGTSPAIPPGRFGDGEQ